MILTLPGIEYLRNIEYSIVISPDHGGGKETKMLDYGLGADEVILVECENVISDGKKIFKTPGNLVLTNKHILFATLNMFGKVKDVERHPLSDIKVYDGTVQAKLDAKFGENPALNIFYKNGQAGYTMIDKSKAIEFVKQLNKTVTGNDIEIETGISAGAAMLGEALRSTTAAFKNAFGIKEPEPEKTIVSCTGCGATITGVKGSLVKCEFCGCSVKLI